MAAGVPDRGGCLAWAVLPLRRYAEFARWNKAAGKVLPGLTRRRTAEAALYAK